MKKGNLIQATFNVGYEMLDRLDDRDVEEFTQHYLAKSLATEISKHIEVEVTRYPIVDSSAGCVIKEAPFFGNEYKTSLYVFTPTEFEDYVEELHRQFKLNQAGTRALKSRDGYNC